MVFFGARKSGLAEAINRPNLTFAVSPKYLSNETKIYISITRIPRGVDITFLGFFKNFIFLTSGRYLQTSALKQARLSATNSVFKPYRITLAPARKAHRTGLLFTHKNGDFRAISVTERSLDIWFNHSLSPEIT